MIGLGRFGSGVALTLVKRGYTVLGIDRDKAVSQQFADELTQTVALDSTDEEALRAVDITSFDTVIVGIGADFESSLLTTVALRSVGVRRIVCKALSERQQSILLKVGADQVILPEHEAGQRLAYMLTTPLMLDQLPLGPEHSITELRPPPDYVGRPLPHARRARPAASRDRRAQARDAGHHCARARYAARPGRYHRRHRTHRRGRPFCGPDLMTTRTVRTPPTRKRFLRTGSRLILGLAILVALGTAALLLPGVATEPLNLADAAFTATSTLAVTGLSVITPYRDLTAAGQAILLIMIEIGGVGFMTGAILILRLLGRKVYLADRLALARLARAGGTAPRSSASCGKWS